MKKETIVRQEELDIDAWWDRVGLRCFPKSTGLYHFISTYPDELFWVIELDSGEVISSWDYNHGK